MIAKPQDKPHDKLIDEIKTRAEQLGFEAFGIAPADIGDTAARDLTAFLDQGFHASMDWMAETAARRAKPNALWPEAKSVIMLGMNYGPESDPLALLEHPTKGNLSVYARNRDYHDIIKGRLKELAGLVARRSGGQVKVFVDTAPVMEKVLAAHAGIGWQGKHTVLVSRDWGSWLFLGAIFTDLDLPTDTQITDNCGTCRACLDICPTYAFPAPYQLDAGKCLSYLSIEHKGPIPRQFRAAMGNRIYGCDDCLAICPWNKFAQHTKEAKLAERPELRAPDLTALVQLDDAGFRALFVGSPVKRIGWARFIRNVLIAVGNSGATELLDVTKAHLNTADPIVRGAAIWAYRRLAEQNDIETAREQFLTQETNVDCRLEWDGELAPALERSSA